MGKRFLGVLAIATAFTGSSASAQLAGLFGKALGLPDKGEVGGTYQSKNRIRTYVTSDPTDTARLYDELVAKAVEMAKAKGSTRIGVTKDGCSTVLVSGSPRSTSCYILAVMLNGQETVRPDGKRDVRYFEVRYGRGGSRRHAAVPQRAHRRRADRLVSRSRRRHLQRLARLQPARLGYL